MSARTAKIILLPGFDGTGELFKDFAACLPPDLEICIVQYSREENHSYADLADYLKGIVPASEPFLIAAESFSVPIAIAHAARNPSNLKGLILCAGFAKSPVSSAWRSLLRWAGSVLFRFSPPGWMIRVLLVGCGTQTSLVRRVQSAVSSVRPQVLSGRLKAVLDCDVRNELKKIRAPILYLQAKHDHVIRPSCGEEILNLNPRCDLIEIEGPHLLLQRRPAECAKAIMLFAKSLGA